MPVLGTREEIHLRGTATGRWVDVVGTTDPLGHGRVRIETGTTGNRLDPARRARRRGHDVVRAGERLELRSWWPVREVRTHAVGDFVAELRGELAETTDDPDAALADLDEITAEVFGEGDDLTGRILRSAYPLLEHPIAAGARPDIVPVTLEPLLRRRDPRSAARGHLGPRVTRPLVRALAEALLPDDDGRIAWEPLLCALMAADRCGPEQLAAVLTTRPHRPGAVSFSHTDIERARAMFADVTPRRVSERLCAALREDGGTTELARALIRHDSRPPAPPPAPAPAPRPQRVVRAAAPPPDPADAPIEYPASWRAAAGATVHGCRVVLPATGNELLEWGTMMDNCLGAYRMSAATRGTRIIGFEHGGRLRYVAEVSASGALRQLEAPGNRLPPPAATAAIVAFLRERRLIETDARRQ